MCIYSVLRIIYREAEEPAYSKASAMRACALARRSLLASILTSASIREQWMIQAAHLFNTAFTSGLNLLRSSVDLLKMSSGMSLCQLLRSMALVVMSFGMFGATLMSRFRAFTDVPTSTSVKCLMSSSDMGGLEPLGTPGVRSSKTMGTCSCRSPSLCPSRRLSTVPTSR